MSCCRTADRLRTLALAGGVFALGLTLGRLDGGNAALAQDEPAAEEEPLPEAAVNEVRATARAVESARDELASAGRYAPATTGLNAFLVLSGGGDAVADLDGDEGVDPETFAALYAGRATDEIKGDLSTDDDGRLLYKGRAVRMYSIERLRKAYDERDRLTSDDGGF